MNFSDIQELYKNTGLEALGTDVGKAILKILKNPLEECISDIQKSVEIINSLLDYISFLEGIFLPEGQHFTTDDLKTPGLSSLLMTSNRHDEKEKREILEFFRDQFRSCYPEIFKFGGRFKTTFGFDNPASILIDAYEKLHNLNTLKSHYSQEQIKQLNICDEKVISFFENDREFISIRCDIFPKICNTLGIENKVENFIKYENSKLLSVFTFDQDEDLVFSTIEIGIKGLKKIKGFDFEGIFDVDLYSFKRWESYNYFFQCIEYFQINNAKDLLLKGINEVLTQENNCDKMTYFKGSTLQIDNCVGWFGRKFTLEEAGNGTLKNIFKIYKGIKGFGVNLIYSKRVFDFIDKQNVGIGTLKDKEISRFIDYIKGFVGKVTTSENVEKEVEVLRELIGVDIDLEWILDGDLSTALYRIIGIEKNENYASLDTKETLYKPFFQKFNRFVGINENGEKYSEKWDKKHFKNVQVNDILGNITIDFILLFLDDFRDISDFITSSVFQNFMDQINTLRINIVNCIKFIRKYNLFEIKLIDLNEEFIGFFNENFTNDGSKKFVSNLNFPQNFFDEEITSVKDFEDPLFKSLILEKSNIFGNLKTICELYNLPVKLSSFREIFTNYVERYKDIDVFFKFFSISGTLDIKIKFIYSRLQEKINYVDLIQMLMSQFWFMSGIGMHHEKEVNEKEQLLKDKFGHDTNSYFRKDEEGNYIFNREKQHLLKFIFDINIGLLDLEEFLNRFTGITLGKLVRFYRDSGLGFGAGSSTKSYFITQYAFDSDNYYYLEHNVDILIGFGKDFHPMLNKLKIILDKTGGFLTKTFVQKFVVEGCSEKKLDEIIKSYNETSKKLLSSDFIEFDRVDETVAEAVFMAYKPTGYTLEKIIELLSYELQDNSKHLEKIKYKKEGYKRSLNKTEKKLKNGHSIDIKVIGEIEKEVLGVTNTEKSGFENFDYKKFFTSATDLKELFPILGVLYSYNDDYRIQEYRKNMGSADYDYARLYSLSNIFGVITKDSFGEVLVSQFSSVSFEELKNIFGKLEKIKDPKFKKLYNENFKQEYLESNNMLFSCFINIFYTQLKFIAIRIKKEIEKEMDKFQDQKSGEGKNIRYSVSKNITSYFAMAGSELCTDGDIERHNEERYIPVNIIDDESKQIIGMLMMYLESERDYLVVRGFNLRKEMFNVYNIDSIVENMVSFVGEFANENGYKKVYIPENGTQHVISNSDEIRRGMKKIYEGNSKKADYERDATFYCGRIGQEGGFTTNKLYLLLNL
ncbi:MAG: hypothetical protein PHH98_05185 [Candidatus Gracilibacteria bacterium]|nr:hypothetical protein [Candidatus Gracilibacteria bacterium]